MLIVYTKRCSYIVLITIMICVYYIYLYSIVYKHNNILIYNYMYVHILLYTYLQPCLLYSTAVRYRRDEHDVYTWFYNDRIRCIRTHVFIQI